MKVRGDPVSANQLSLLLFFKVVCMIISPCAVVLFRSWFLMSLKSLSMRSILFQSCIRSVMYTLVLDLLFLFHPVLLLMMVILLDCPPLLCSLRFLFVVVVFLWNFPLFFGSGGICDLHIFAKCPGFLHMLHCEIFAGNCCCDWV